MARPANQNQPEIFESESWVVVTITSVVGQRGI